MRAAGNPFGQYLIPMSNPFENAPVIYAYTRKQALADGFQIEITETAKEAGIRFRVFLNRTVFDRCVAVPEGVAGQDEQGRLWDVLWMLKNAILRAAPGVDEVAYVVLVRNDNTRARPVQLVAKVGAVDIDDPTPAITIMFPGED